MSLAPYQLAFNGLTFGANTGIEILTVSGLREAPPTRGSDVVKARRHGSWAGRTLFGERIVTLSLQVMAAPDGSATFEQQLAKLSAAFANIAEPTALLPLAFNLSPAWSSARQVIGRPTKGGVPVNADYAHGKAIVPVEFTCPDPIIYDTVTQSVSCGLPSPTAGLSFNTGFPISFGSSSGGSMQVGNTGNETFYPVWEIAGPVTYPTLTCGSASLGFAVTLASGDMLEVDTGAKTATLNGTGARQGTVLSGSTWFGIPSGGATVGFSSADSAQVAGNVSSWPPAGAWGWC